MDKKVSEIIKNEEKFQRDFINLIPSDNYASKNVLEALGSVFSNRYAEGKPGKRYYSGQKNNDAIENLAVERALKMFNLSDRGWHVNVQPYSGSPANLAVYLGLLKIGDKIMGMRLADGGHLSQGFPASISGQAYTPVNYGVNPETGYIDYDEVLNLAKKEKPKLIVCGFTAYSRVIDFERFGRIAKEVDAYLLADISHIAGLVVAGVHPSPFPHADVVMTTSHKTLRGPRGAIIICKKALAAIIDRGVFPGVQGGPHENQIAACAVCFGEALTPEFKNYAEQIVKNAKTLANVLMQEGLPVISGGTDTHLMLVDLRPYDLPGKTCEEILEKVGILVNKNKIPGDNKPSLICSGIRIGTPAATTRGMKEEEMRIIGKCISGVIKNPSNTRILSGVKAQIKNLVKKFPIDF